MEEEPTQTLELEYTSPLISNSLEDDAKPWGKLVNMNLESIPVIPTSIDLQEDEFSIGRNPQSSLRIQDNRIFN
jgi:hypothetical protein